MIKIVIICQAFVSEFMVYRWRKMVCDYSDVEITLVGPTKCSFSDWGNNVELGLNRIEEERFRFVPLHFVCHRLWMGGWAAIGLIKLLKQTNPDFIYLIGTETNDLTLQVAWAKRCFVQNAKLALFTMRGTNMPLQNLNFSLRWKIIRSAVDAFFCHCPRCVEVLRLQGKVTKPIYMQTQVGVPVEIFRPDPEKRQRVRRLLCVKDDEYLFGSVSRMDVRKGLLDMLEALPVKAKWKFVMIGSGPDQKIVENAVREKKLTGQVLLPGKMDYPYEVAEYINALDCSVLMSKTLADNCDTFALAVAQSMAVGLPVIVSDSGGLPYQVGKDGIVVHEGDVSGLHEAMEYLSSNSFAGRKIGEAMRARLLNSFSVPHLNHCFYDTMQDIMGENFNDKHTDQQDFTFTK